MVYRSLFQSTKYLQGFLTLHTILGRLSFYDDTCKSNFCLFWHRLVTQKPSAGHHGITKAVQFQLHCITQYIYYYVLFSKVFLSISHIYVQKVRIEQIAIRSKALSQRQHVSI